MSAQLEDRPLNVLALLSVLFLGMEKGTGEVRQRSRYLLKTDGSKRSCVEKSTR